MKSLKELRVEASNTIYQELDRYVALRELDNQIKDMIIEATEITIDEIFASLKPLLIEIIPEEYI